MMDGFDKTRARRGTLRGNADRIAHFERRIIERGDSPDDVVIALINADDPVVGPIAHVLVPGCDWKSFRDLGQIPLARGLTGRAGIQQVLDELDPQAGRALEAAAGKVVVVVMDLGGADVFVKGGLF